MNILEIKDVTYNYSNSREKVLSSVNQKFELGQFYAIIGKSGAGKSTLLSLLAGLDKPQKGKILFKNEDIEKTGYTNHRKNNISLVFQNYNLIDYLTPLENIRLVNKKASKEILLELGLNENQINRNVLKLSGGQQQRVAIARALVIEPSLLLLDEPLSNLDARLRLKIREEIRRLVKEIGITTIFVTHDQEEALSISDRIVLMNQGIVQQFDIPQNLYLEPANLFVAKFMGNPIINIYEMNKEGNVLVGDDFSIDLGLLNESSIKQSFNEDKYVVGIRPEYFILSDTPLFKGKIETAELIGKDCILNFDVNGKISKSITDTHNKITEGEEVGFGIDYNSIYIFKENGVRVY